jgi:hypothetical protein
LAGRPDLSRHVDGITITNIVIVAPDRPSERQAPLLIGERKRRKDVTVAALEIRRIYFFGRKGD